MGISFIDKINFYLMLFACFLMLAIPMFFIFRRIFEEVSYLVISKYYDDNQIDVFIFPIDFEQSKTNFNKENYDIDFNVFESEEAACDYIVSKLGVPLDEVIRSDDNEFLKYIIDVSRVKK